MLSEIFSRFLRFSTEETSALMELLSLESRWKEANAFKTQQDLIDWLQNLGQTSWFKGHDRSKFPADTVNDVLKRRYFELFEKLGLIQAKTLNTAPDCSVILGSSESQVKARLASFENDVQRGLRPNTKKVFGLGANRSLGNGVKTSEKDSILALQEKSQEPTEMNMVSLWVAPSAQQYGLEYVPINTTSSAPARESASCVKTSDTAASLKTVIEINPSVRIHTIAAYSNQPFVERQRRDIEKQLGLPYEVIGVGKAVSWEEFRENESAISICLGEVARIINTSYRSCTIKLEQKLTRVEQLELFLKRKGIIWLSDLVATVSRACNTLYTTARGVIRSLFHGKDRTKNAPSNFSPNTQVKVHSATSPAVISGFQAQSSQPKVNSTNLAGTSQSVSPKEGTSVRL